MLNCISCHICRINKLGKKRTLTNSNHILLHVPMSTCLFECKLTQKRLQKMFSLQRCLMLVCVPRVLISPLGIIIIDEMTLRIGQQGLYRALAIASRDAKERMQKTRMRYARSSQRLLTRTTAPVGALATSMNINYSDRDEMPRIPVLFLAQLVAPLFDRCRLQQPICKFARSLYLRLKASSFRLHTNYF